MKPLWGTKLSRINRQTAMGDFRFITGENSIPAIPQRSVTRDRAYGRNGTVDLQAPTSFMHCKAMSLPAGI